MAVHLIEHRILLAAVAVRLNLDVNPVLTLIDLQVGVSGLRWVGPVWVGPARRYLKQHADEARWQQADLLRQRHTQNRRHLYL
jgi:acyl dehydratase